MHFDFTGTGRRARAGRSTSRANTTLSSCYVALKHIFPDVPVNGGTFRPITLHGPGRHACSRPSTRRRSAAISKPVGRILDVVFGALAQAIPRPHAGRVLRHHRRDARSAARHPRTGRYFVGGVPLSGRLRRLRRRRRAGQRQRRRSRMANFMSIEMSEHRYPGALRLLRAARGFRRRRLTSAAAAARPTGFDRLVRHASVSVLGDRVDHVALRRRGRRVRPRRTRSSSAAAARSSGRPSSRSKQEKQLAARRRRRDDLRSPGGGGFGNPLERDLDAVERDLNLGYICARDAPSATMAS